MVKGWHFGNWYPAGSGGLPVRVYDRPSLMTSWAIDHEHTDAFEMYNSSWDIWFGGVDDPNPSPDQPGAEVMVWLNHMNQMPIGWDNKIDTVNIWGKNFDLFQGKNSIGGDVFTFINQSNDWRVDNVNLFDFFDYLWAQKNYIDGRRYFIGIEAGNELMDGEGSFAH